MVGLISIMVEQSGATRVVLSFLMARATHAVDNTLPLLYTGEVEALEKIQSLFSSRAAKHEEEARSVHGETDSQLHELDLELNLALCRAEEAEAWAEETRDEATIAEDMAAESATECEWKVETLRRKLKDQLGNIIKEARFIPGFLLRWCWGLAGVW
ncbi:hypothetical protein B296_00003154, partial [Ensete ventricosum]